VPQLGQRFHARSKKSLCYPDNLLPRLQSTLAALADLRKPLATDSRKNRRLPQRRNDEREPNMRKARSRVSVR
jgi:hypothetical protein